MHAIDIDAYFRRIGYAGPRMPTQATLSAIHRLHPQAIAFENLDPLLRRPVLLDPASLERKLVHGGRGGYCFEHNLLLAQVLAALGFRVRRLAARVLWNQPEEAATPRSHMLLLIELAGERWVADVGFGGITLTAPLRLVAGIEQATPHEPFRLLEGGGYFVLQALIRDTWRAAYRFDLQEQLQVDYEVSSWYLCNHPDSRFVTGLMAARAVADRRYALLDKVFTVHHLHGGSERRVLRSAAALHEVLITAFGLTLPAEPELDAALAALAARAG